MKQPSRLLCPLDQADSGEEIVSAKVGKPDTRNPLRPNRIPGQDAGKVQIAEDFDAPSSRGAAVPI